MPKAVAVNAGTVWPDEAAQEGKTRQQAETSLKSGGEKRQWRRPTFVWAVSSRVTLQEATTKTPVGHLRSKCEIEVAHFWEVCGFRRYFLTCVSTKLTFMRTRLFSCFFGVLFFISRKAKGVFYMWKFHMKELLCLKGPESWSSISLRCKTTSKQVFQLPVETLYVHNIICLYMVHFFEAKIWLSENIKRKSEGI